jgi:hypothetical protein
MANMLQSVPGRGEWYQSVPGKGEWNLGFSHVWVRTHPVRRRREARQTRRAAGCSSWWPLVIISPIILALQNNIHLKLVGGVALLPSA